MKKYREKNNKIKELQNEIERLNNIINHKDSVICHLSIMRDSIKNPTVRKWKAQYIIQDNMPIEYAKRALCRKLAEEFYEHNLISWDIEDSEDDPYSSKRLIGTFEIVDKDDKGALIWNQKSL